MAGRQTGRGLFVGAPKRCGLHTALLSHLGAHRSARLGSARWCCVLAASSKSFGRHLRTMPAGLALLVENLAFDGGSRKTVALQFGRSLSIIVGARGRLFSSARKWREGLSGFVAPLWRGRKRKESRPLRCSGEQFAERNNRRSVISDGRRRGSRIFRQHSKYKLVVIIAESTPPPPPPTKRDACVASAVSSASQLWALLSREIRRSSKHTHTESRH